MTNLLLRLFIKDHADVKSPKVRARIGRFAGGVGILCNLLLAAAKILVGILLGSVAIAADGLNNLSDTAASVVAVIGFRLAQSPADKDHPYGHGRFEYLSALGVAILILFVGVELIKLSIEKILSPTPIDLSFLAVAILTVSILVKLFMMHFFKELWRRTESSILRAAAQDSRNDVLVTAATLAGCLIYRYTDLNLDGYIGLGVALFILVSGFGVAKETISPLLGRRADSAITDGLATLILSHDRILGIHDLLVHDYGPGQCYATVHAEISASESPLTCHELIDRIEAATLAKMNVHLVIHYDPVAENDEEQNRLRATVEHTLSGLAPHLSIHDFRLTRAEEGDTLLFDVSIPYAMLPQEENIRSALTDALAAADYHGSTVIRFDAY